MIAPLTTVEIRNGFHSDAEKILRLQRLCLLEESALYGDAALAPRLQNLQQLRHQYASHRFFVAQDGMEIVGSVRGRLREGDCEISRLMVHPDYRGRRIATRLFAAIEEYFENNSVRRHFLHIGHRSPEILGLYRRLGYAEIRRQVVSAQLTLVHLEKRLPLPQPAGLSA